MIIATGGGHPGTLGEVLLVFPLYGLFFRRLFKNNPGNRLVECGSITLIVFLAMLPINKIGDVPDWLFGAWLILILLLCVAMLFFLFQRMFHAIARRSNQ